MHGALETLAWKSIHRETGFLTHQQAPNIALVNRRLDLHIGQVLCNHKKLWRLQAAGNGLPSLNRSLDHDAVHGRGDLGAGQINARLGQRRIALRDIGFSGTHLRLGNAHLGLRRFQGLGAGVHQSPGFVALALGNELFFNQTEGALLRALGFR